MAETTPQPPDAEVVVLVVMGVTGTGKSTVAGLLARRLGWDLEEGDDLHPEANVAKMRAGQPLVDADRWPWLDRVGAWIRAHTRSGTPGIITCSSLKRSYRDRLRGPGVVFVHLAGTREAIQARLDGRKNHFMPSSLLDSQLQTLEPLGPDERGLVVPLGGRPEDEAQRVLDQLHLEDLPSGA
jgi:gluconokinase